MEKLGELLGYLEDTIDTVHIKNTRQKLCAQLAYEPLASPCVKVGYGQDRFLPFPYPETADDMGKMMYNELVAALCSIEAKDDGLPMLRANYGIGILPSLFGLSCRILNGNLPWVNHLESLEEVKALIDAGVPDLDSGFGRKVCETYEFYAETLSKYPKCREGIGLYHADLQGPFDVAHLMIGADIYMTLYDDPDLVKDLMELVTDTYIAYMKKMKPYLNDEFGGNCLHWNVLYGGKIVLRNDSAVNLSPTAYAEFVKPYDEKILKAFGGGSIHFCGRADHWVFDMLDTEGLRAINFGYMPNLTFGQEYLDFIMPRFSEKQIPVAGYTLSVEEADKFPFATYRTGISYIVNFDTKEDAEAFLKRTR